MKRQYVHVLIAALLILMASCQTAHVRKSGPDVSLDEAKELLVSGQVREVFQPHVGCIVLTLKDGRLITFDQPHLDWILIYLSEQGLSDTIPVSME